MMPWGFPAFAWMKGMGAKVEVGSMIRASTLKRKIAASIWGEAQNTCCELESKENTRSCHPEEHSDEGSVIY